VPLGQSAGQRILARLAQEIARRRDAALATATTRAPGLQPHAGHPVGPARNPVLAAVPIMTTIFLIAAR
jgi:hypothetical protein